MDSPNTTDVEQVEEASQSQSAVNPNSLHDFHTTKRGPKGIPHSVKVVSDLDSPPKDPGHQYARTEHISFDLLDQRKTNAPFGYEYFVSLPPQYNEDIARRWPLIFFLHGSGESQCNPGESFLCLRHGIPKVILCYDKLRSGHNPSISIPFIERGRKDKQSEHRDLSEEPVSLEVCTLVAENFITATPSLNMKTGYGWSAPILSALLDEIQDRYRVDEDRVHATGFSMGGYGTWSLATHLPEKFASLLPICGGGDPKTVSNIKHVPHWVYHGEDDDAIPIEASQQMIDALRKAGANEVQFTRLPDTKHDSWTAAYNNPDIYHWMLDQRRKTETKKSDIVP